MEELAHLSCRFRSTPFQISQVCEKVVVFIALIAPFSLRVLVMGTRREKKERVIVTCDPELDGHISLIRYLLVSTDFDTAGPMRAASFTGKVTARTLLSISQVANKHVTVGTSAHRLIGDGLRTNVLSMKMWRHALRYIQTW